MLETVNDYFKRLVVLVRPFLHVHDNVAIHLNETTVTVPSEALVLGSLGQRRDGFIVQAEVENCVHHTRHGIAGPGAHRHQQGHGGFVAKLRAHDFFYAGHGALNFRFERSWIGFLVSVVVGANLGGNCETRRHGEDNAAHFSKASPLPTEQRALTPVSFRFTCTKKIHPLFHSRPRFP